MTTRSHRLRVAAFGTRTCIEIAIKQRTGKLEFALDLRDMRHTSFSSGIRELSISSDHAMLPRSLPLIHRDPFGRLLIAQAIADNLTLLTVHKTLTDYSSQVRSAG